MLVATLTQYNFGNSVCCQKVRITIPTISNSIRRAACRHWFMTAIAVWNSLVDENDYLMNRWTEFLNARCWDIRSSKLPLHQIRYAELALGSNLHALEGSFEWTL